MSLMLAVEQSGQHCTISADDEVAYLLQAVCRPRTPVLADHFRAAEGLFHRNVDAEGHCNCWNSLFTSTFSKCLASYLHTWQITNHTQ